MAHGDSRDPPTVARISAVVADWARHEPLIRRAYLFGSRAKGTARPDSDIDIAILYRPDPALVKAHAGQGAFPARWFTWEEHSPRWREELIDLLGLPVDLQLPGARLRPELKRHGIRLYPPTNAPA